MKFVSFTKEGRDGFGIITEDGIIDLTNKIVGASSLRHLIENQELEAAANIAKDMSADISTDQVTFQPVIPDPGKIICVGLNYRDHVTETGRTIEDNPVIFLRYPDSQIGHQQPMVRPTVSDNFDFEAEMAIVMSGGGRHIDPADALDHIAGYTCYNDGTLRDWQRHTSQFGMGKNFMHTGSFGPWMVTADEIPDHTQLELIMRLNGQEMQRAPLKDLIFDVPTLISYVSKALPWKAGDVLVTGTPGGVGFKRNPPVFMKPGDIAEVEITMIGTLTNSIADEQPQI